MGRELATGNQEVRQEERISVVVTKKESWLLGTFGLLCSCATKTIHQIPYCSICILPDWDIKSSQSEPHTKIPVDDARDMGMD